MDETKSNPKVRRIIEGLKELPVSIKRTTAYAIARMLQYSFEPIHYDYKGLTPLEKVCVTPEEFSALVNFTKALVEPTQLSDAEVDAFVAKEAAESGLDPLWGVDVTVADLQAGCGGALGSLFLLIEKLWCGHNRESYTERFGRVRCGTAYAFNRSSDENGVLMVSFRFPFPKETVQALCGKDCAAKLVPDDQGEE